MAERVIVYEEGGEPSVSRVADVRQVSLAPHGEGKAVVLRLSGVSEPVRISEAFRPEVADEVLQAVCDVVFFGDATILRIDLKTVVDKAVVRAEH